MFYKTLSTIGTLGIVVLSSTQVWTTLKKQNNSEAEISKTLVELRKARKETLDEVKTTRSNILKELDSIRSNSLSEIKTDRANSLIEMKTAKMSALRELKSAGGNKDEDVLLVLRYGGTSTKGNSRALQVIRVKDMDECQLMGAQWTSSELVKNEYEKIDIFGFSCLEN